MSFVDNGSYTFLDFRLDAAERTLFKNDVRLPLTDKAFEVLCLLVREHGLLVAKERFFDEIWQDTIVEPNNLDKCISLIRRTLGEQKDGYQFIETVRGHGYRFVADLKDGTETQPANGERELSKINTLAVLPFTNFGNDSQDEYFCEGVAEEIINSLTRVKDLRVAARTSAFSFKGKPMPIGSIARALGVANILEGSLRRSGDKLFVTVRLIEGRSGYSIWSEQYDRSVDNIFALQDEITISIIEALNVKLGVDERTAVLKKPTSSTDAYLLYMKGQYYRWRLIQDNFANSLKYFEQSVEADPTFALGYFGIATYYGYGTAWGMLPIRPEKAWPMAEAAAKKAFELDPTSRELRLSFAAFDLVNYRRWSEAGRQIESVAADHPEFPEIHHLYSFYLLALGLFDKAIAEARRALKLDPLSQLLSRFVGVCYFYARRYDEAIAQFLDAAELEPNNPLVHEMLGGVYLRTGQREKALASWLRAARLSEDDDTAEFISARVGDDQGNGVADVIQWMASRKLEKLNAQSEAVEYIPSIYFAQQYIILNDLENAFKWLDRACGERNVFPLLINSDPFYDPLRGDSRFANLWERISLAE